MSAKYSMRGKKHVLEVRYINERDEEIYQVFDGKSREDVDEQAKKVVPAEHLKEEEEKNET